MSNTISLMIGRLYLQLSNGVFGVGGLSLCSMRQSFPIQYKVAWIKSHHAEFSKALQSNRMGLGERETVTVQVQWIYPPPSWLKLNVDGALNPMVLKVDA